MQWQKLLSPLRFGKETKSHNKEAIRSAFEMDFDRVVFLESFRRLQNKTQVIPLPEDAFVHNRLTHSLEVSSVGRTLGKLVGEAVIKQNPELKKEGIEPLHFGAIVASAALAHDIGNPPFGHAGEKAISEFYTFGEGQIYEAELTKKQWGDLSNFEGNAHGFRLLTNSISGIAGGARLTYATLATFSKYPKESYPKSTDKRASGKKYGFFQSEKKMFKDVANDVGLISRSEKPGDLQWVRHPLAFLVEAADDISYTVIDLEDGYGLGIISFEQFEELIIPLCGPYFNKKRYQQIGVESEKVRYMRSLAINYLVNSLAGVFIKNEKEILAGTFDTPLIDSSELKPLAKKIIQVSAQKIYNSPSVVEIEMAGFEVLKGLLGIYTEAIQSVFEGDSSYYHSKIVQQLPDECFAANRKPDEDLYLRLLKVTSYVASMTDAQAITKYRYLKGIELPKHH
jgi:dGTPase